MSKKHVKIVRSATLFCDTLKNPCDILGLTTDFSVSFNYGFEAAMMY
jgi:hypothetical protein